jgi:hypothetical protein
VTHAARMGQIRNALNVLVRVPERKRPLGRRSSRFYYNTRMHFGETGWKVVDWMDLAQDRGQWWA